MSHYEIGTWLWSAIFAAGLLVPLVALVLYETRRAVDCLTGRDLVRPSLPPSHPSHPAPSHPGY